MKRIVLLEDDEAIRDVFQLVLAGTYEIIELDNGYKILSDEIERPDLFILDKSVAGTDGPDVCRYIKNNEKYNETPVIMLSANPDIPRLAREAGADGAIAKPFSVTTLRDMLKNLLQD